MFAQSFIPAAEPAYGRTASVHLCRATRQNPSGGLDEFGHSVRDVQSAARRVRVLSERHPVFECGKLFTFASVFCGEQQLHNERVWSSSPHDTPIIQSPISLPPNKNRHATELGATPASDRFVVQPFRHKRRSRHTAQFAVLVCVDDGWRQVCDRLVVASRSGNGSSRRSSGQAAESPAAHQVSADAAGTRPYAEHHVQATHAAFDRRGLESAHLCRNELAPAAAECRRGGRPNTAAARLREDRISAGEKKKLYFRKCARKAV